MELDILNRDEADILNQYEPDYVTPPGETLLETIEALDMSQAELARRTGRPKKTINEIIQGKTAITPDTAIQFERVLGVPANFWLRMEQQYRESLARLQDKETLETQLPWLEQIPLDEMVGLGWVEKQDSPVDQLREVLRFYAVASVEQYHAVWDYMFETVSSFSPAFKEADKYALAAWLRQGEIVTQQIYCAPYDKAAFQQTLEHLGELTFKDFSEIQSNIVEQCAKVGVAIAFVPDLPGMIACRATRWLSPEKALLQICDCYPLKNQFWFAFFHAAAHLLFHGKREFFLENDNQGGSSEKEEEAKRFAGQMLKLLD